MVKRLVVCALAISYGLVHAQTAVSVEGHIYAKDGGALPAATVTFSNRNTAEQYVTVTGAAPDPGKYTQSLPPGTYLITVRKAGYTDQPRDGVAIAKDLQLSFVLDPGSDSCPRRESPWWTLATALAYLATIFLVRWYNIARPNRELLRAQADIVKTRLLQEMDPARKKDDAEALLAILDREIEAATRCGNFLDFLFWTRGKEVASWSRLHEVERDMILLNARGEASLSGLRARLQSVQFDLLEIDKARAKSTAALIGKVLDEPAAGEDELRALLVQSITYLHNQTDNGFAQLVGWQTKSVWLTTIGILGIVTLAFSVGNEILFLAGSVGGYLSRLSRTLKRADVPSDYGASWTTLFLSPIVGALSAWFGILLVVMFSDDKLKILGAAFQAIQWCSPVAPMTLGLAFAFGFSERLFDTIMSSLEEKVDKDRSAAKEPQEPQPSAPIAQKQPPEA